MTIKFPQTALLWNRLILTRNLTFTSTSQTYILNGQGRGKVVVIQNREDEILFEEKGSWTSPIGESFTFFNTYLWKMNPKNGEVSLEHDRRTSGTGTHLIHFFSFTPYLFLSKKPHLCTKDQYLAKIICSRDGFFLQWNIIGPKKNETLITHYMRKSP